MLTKVTLLHIIRKSSISHTKSNHQIACSANSALGSAHQKLGPNGWAPTICFKFGIITATLLFFLSFTIFRRVHNRSSRIVVYCRVLTCDSEPESGSAKFYWLQLRLRLKPKRSTLTNSNSGLDSDSQPWLQQPVNHRAMLELGGPGRGDRFGGIVVTCPDGDRHIFELPSGMLSECLNERLASHCTAWLDGRNR